MGWKGTIRSISAANNSHNRFIERSDRQQQKQLDALHKKLEKIEVNREKVLSALKNDFAANKLTKEEYEKLQGRMAEVTDEILIFGKTPAITLCKNYVCGKIDKPKFDEVKTELVPAALDIERNSIMNTIAQKHKQQEDFLSACEVKVGHCSRCSKEKRWYSLFGQLNNMFICSKCIREYKSYREYAGFNGDYLTAEPCEVAQQMKLNVKLKQNWL